MTGAYPLSDMQQSMLVHEALAGRPVYAMPLCFRITGPLDPGLLERAWHHVVRRHPVLMCRYDGDIAEPAIPAAPLPPLRLAAAPAGGALPALAPLWEEPFDLAEELPWRAGLVSSSGGEHHLGLAVHHVAGDSWSLALLTGEWARAYEALVAGREPDGEPVVNFFDQVARERADAADVSWWAENLAGAVRPPAPPERVDDDTDRGAFRAVDLRLDATLTRGVRRAGETARVSSSVLLLTAVSVTVAEPGPRGTAREATVGLPALLRDDASLHDCVGPLLNTVPVRTRWTCGDPASRLVARHGAAVEAALAHRAVPYSTILRAAGGRDAPLFRHVVNVDTETPRLRITGLRTAPVPIPPRWANFPALWEFGWGAVGNLHGVLRAEAGSYTAAEADALAGRFRETLTSLLAGLRPPVQ